MEKLPIFQKKHPLISQGLLPLFFVICTTALFSIVSMFWFYKSGSIFSGYDWNFHIGRLIGLSYSLSAHTFPFYVNPFFYYGMGYACNLFYGEVLLLFPALLLYFHMDLVLVLKLFFVLLAIATAVTSYFSLLLLFEKKNIAICGSLFYTFSVYRAADLYMRFALGEVVAFVFLPLIITGCAILFTKPKAAKWCLIIGFSGLLYSHLISFTLAILYLLFYLVFHYKKIIKDSKTLYPVLSAGVIAVGLCAYQLFPMLEQLVSQSFRFQTSPLTVPYENTYTLSDLIKSITNLPFHDSSYVIGIGFFILFVLILRLLLKKQKDSAKVKTADRFLLGAILLLACTSDWFPWKLLTPLNFLQFPWRLCLFITLFLSISAAVYLDYFDENKKRCLLYACSFLVLFSNLYILGFKYRNTYEHTSRSIESGQALSRAVDPTAVSGGEYLPAVSPPGEINYLSQLGVYFPVDYQHVTIDQVERTLSALTFHYTSDTQTTQITVPYLYYKGYSITVNSQSVETKKSDIGLLQFETSEQEGIVEIRYRGTMIQKVSFLISILTFLFAGIYGMREFWMWLKAKS
jgi:hypothetical protein